MTAAETYEYPKVYLYRRIVQAKLFIDDKYAEKIDLDNIADEAYFSKFHFIRQFKKIYGKTPHQYLIQVRLKHALDLLSKGYAVSDVCALVGFESLSSFSGLFKRTMGKTPSAYLEQQLQRLKNSQNAPEQYVPGCFAKNFGWT